MTADAPAPPTIEGVFTSFLADQKVRLAPSTYRRYAEVVDLFRDSLNGYGPQNLDRDERHRFEEAYDTGDEDAFVHLFGPDKITENLGEFLGYFMVRKVICGEALLRAAGTVTKKLAAWLGVHCHISGDDVADAIDRGVHAAHDLPRADRLARRLSEETLRATLDPESLDESDYIEDHLSIERVDPGALWFEGGVGPLRVRKETSSVAQPGWSVSITLGRSRGVWQVLAVGDRRGVQLLLSSRQRSG